MDHLGRSEIFPGIDCTHLEIPKIIYDTRKYKMSFYFVQKVHEPRSPRGLDTVNRAKIKDILDLRIF